MANKPDEKMIAALRKKALEEIQINSNGETKTGVSKTQLMRAFDDDATISSMKRRRRKDTEENSYTDYNRYTNIVLNKLMEEDLIYKEGNRSGTRYFYNAPKMKAVNLHTNVIVFFKIISGDINDWLPLINNQVQQLDLGYEVHLIPIGSYLMCINESDCSNVSKTSAKELENIISDAITAIGCNIELKEIQKIENR